MQTAKLVFAVIWGLLFAFWIIGVMSGFSMSMQAIQIYGSSGDLNTTAFYLNFVGYPLLLMGLLVLGGIKRRFLLIPAIAMVAYSIFTFEQDMSVSNWPHMILSVLLLVLAIMCLVWPDDGAKKQTMDEGPQE